jgi:hypothetical protein
MTTTFGELTSPRSLWLRGEERSDIKCMMSNEVSRGISSFFSASSLSLSRLRERVMSLRLSPQLTSSDFTALMSVPTIAPAREYPTATTKRPAPPALLRFPGFLERTSESLTKHDLSGRQYQCQTPYRSGRGLAIYGESKSKVSFVANFTAEWNHEEHCAEEPFKHALAARPVCALTLAPRATVTFVHMHSIANFPERRPDQATVFSGSRVEPSGAIRGCY